MQWKKRIMPDDCIIDYKYTVRYGKRNSIQISIVTGDPPYVLVKAPNRCNKAVILRELQTHDLWIRKKLKETEKNLKAVYEQGILSDQDIVILKAQAKEYIPQRVSYHAKRMGIEYDRIFIRAQKTRWGSCSAKGNLNFNCLLMLTPPEVIDSVIVHELAHRIHMNHSKAFYETVYKYFPDYRKWNSWLKENGKTILLRMKEGQKQE
ncbi:MAG: M48 family metallopeptidase [Oscillospiraceae bacterium]|nr:M48 family metallopeptidase [Oscillospiraceae bacterium]